MPAARRWRGVWAARVTTGYRPGDGGRAGRHRLRRPPSAATAGPAAPPLEFCRNAGPDARARLRLFPPRGRRAMLGKTVMPGEPLRVTPGWRSAGPPAGAKRITAVTIYATSVTAMFGVSALYHRGTWTEAWRRRMQRLDHVMIFFLIAGTATPVLLLAVPGTFGLAWLIVVWTLAVAAAAIHLRWM